MLKLVTHIKPHLDDICALWLLKKFDSKFENAEIGFVPTNHKGGEVDKDPNKTYIGVGRGKFDEHKGDLQECSSTLVWKDLKKRGLVKDTKMEKAITYLLGWVLKEDTGKLKDIAYSNFTVPSILHGFYRINNDDSLKLTEFGFSILDSILYALKDIVTLEEEWKDRIEIKSKFGKAAAFETSVFKGIDQFVYQKGFTVAIFRNTKKGYVKFKAKADSDIDFTSLYKRIKKEDFCAGWYLHHSKKMLICGSECAPNEVLSNLSFERLVKIFREEFES
ncbi:hypothetical protein COY23_03820 [bacterium (Candidatus Torokbacteria) CG_4_10_14_0_2_um_filter_35_8]|nr:MAG: hypothetical protein COY23_03820 [bacterium (Candidatus Torokbacteria) CG_4_10_14_0_2_um_filter_35_8]